MRRLASSTAIILATLTGVFLVWELHTVFILLIVSLVIAATVRPLVDWFARRHLPRSVALLLAYVIFVGFIVALITILSAPLFNDVQAFTTDVTSGYENLTAQWPNGTPFQQSLVQQLPAANDLYEAITGPQGSTLFQGALGFTLGFFDLLSQLLICLVLSMYWSADQEHFKRLWVSLLPVEMRIRAREAWQNIEIGLGAYLRSQLIQSFLALILLGIGYEILGLKYPIALAIIATIGWLIPWVGVLIAIIPAALVGLMISPALGIGTAVFTLGILAFLEYFVEPRLFNRRRFSSLLVVIVVLVLVDQWGLVGVLIAPPFAAVLQIFANQLLRPVSMPEVTEPIKERLQVVQTILAEQPEPPPEMMNSVERLTELVQRASA